MAQKTCSWTLFEGQWYANSYLYLYQLVPATRDLCRYAKPLHFPNCLCMSQICHNLVPKMEKCPPRGLFFFF